MAHLKTYQLVFLLFWSLAAVSQSHDFEIRDYHENTSDLAAISSNIKDLNGVTAALLRFAVRDTSFTFDANNGILKIEKHTGEVWLYVPDGTKRITVRHPYLGILRDYQLPLVAKSKTTYDAEIVITRNSFQQTPPPVQVVVPEPEVTPPQANKPIEEKVRPKTKSAKHSNIHFLLGAGFNALSVMGPSLNVGVEIGRLMVSADYTIGIEKVEGVGVFYKPRGGSESLGEAYDYSSSRLSLRLGFNTAPDAIVQVVPQLGVSFNMISGSEITKAAGVEAQFSKANPLSALVAVSLRVKLAGPLSLSITPQYDFVVGKDAVFDVIKDADSKIKLWGEGFGVNAGLLLRF